MPKHQEEGERKDWFDVIDEKLEVTTQQNLQNMTAMSTQKINLTKTLLEDFLKIQNRFNKIKVHLMLIPPNENVFAVYDAEFKERCRLKPDYEIENVNQLVIRDTTQEGGRATDALSVHYLMRDNEWVVQIAFEFCEGEHYYRYHGWKHHFARHILYETPLNTVNIDKIHEILAGLVKVWYESHIEADRNILISHIKDNYTHVERFVS